MTATLSSDELDLSHEPVALQPTVKRSYHGPNIHKIVAFRDSMIRLEDVTREYFHVAHLQDTRNNIPSLPLEPDYALELRRLSGEMRELLNKHIFHVNDLFTRPADPVASTSSHEQRNLVTAAAKPMLSLGPTVSTSSLLS